MPHNSSYWNSNFVKQVENTLLDLLLHISNPCCGDCRCNYSIQLCNCNKVQQITTTKLTIGIKSQKSVFMSKCQELKVMTLVVWSHWIGTARIEKHFVEFDLLTFIQVTQTTNRKTVRLILLFRTDYLSNKIICLLREIGFS